MKVTTTSGLRLAAGLVGLGLCSAFALADKNWINLTNETSSRFLVAPALGASDPEEKDYVWGDVNNNGWTDLVIMRKQPFSTPGKRVNVLMMNEGGVLVDRTSVYATATDVPGDQGFLTPTNDRHSVLADLLNNGWLDLTTATTYGQTTDPKSVSHPRIYINLGDAAAPGTWQGFRFENDRMPTWTPRPNTCGVAAGDINQSGFNDLYFVTYSQSPPDMLIINDGNGFFTDQTLQFLPSNFANAGFGTYVVVADINGNGFNDIMKSEASTLKFIPNLGGGNFGSLQNPPNGATYHFNVGDLNNNGRLDILLSDDGSDRIVRNQSTNANGSVSWASATMLPEHANGVSPSTGFNGNVYAVDLNNNGWNDIVQADVDVDAGGCGRHSNIYRNNQNGPNVTFTWDPATVPASMRQGTHDFGLLDITGNGWIDIVVGRCSGTQVWINNPPFDLDFEYPDGRPAVVDVGTPTPIVVALTPAGGSVKDGSVRLHTSINGSAWQETVMSTEGSDVYVGELPAMECLDEVEWFITAEVGEVSFNDPPEAPADVYLVFASTGTDTTVDENFDTNDGGFTVVNDPSLTQGAWSYGTPMGSNFFGQIAAPFGDASGDGKAWVTCLGGSAATCNVVQGPTHLISPVIDLSAGSAEIVYDRWVFCHNAHLPDPEDFLRTYVSNDGGDTWTFVHQTSGTGNTWETASFLVSEFVAPTGNVKVRFSIQDEGADSITNAGIDNLRVEAFVCDDPGAPCPADLTGDGSVGVADLLGLLAAWGSNPGHPADLTGDDNVGVADLLALLAAWGPCPQ